MKNAKLWSVLLAAILLCACALGVLFTGASAEDGTVEWAVGSGGDYATVEEALAAAETRGWAQNEQLILNVTGTHTATVTDGILFGQKTIWRRLDADGNATVYGNKLPITITGGSVDIDSAATTAACANDYTFDGVTLNWTNNALRFFAGSGQITLKDCALGTTPSKWASRKFYIFGDNNTAKAYDGWTAADLETILKVEEGDDKATLTTSITLDNTSYNNIGSGGYYPRMGAKGSTTAWTATIGSKVLKPTDTKAAFIFGNGATVGRVGGIVTEGEGTWVDEVIIKMLDGAIVDKGGIVGDSGSQSTGSDFGEDVKESYEGDISIYLLGGTYTGTNTVGVRALTSASLKGNVYVEADGVVMKSQSDSSVKVLYQYCFDPCHIDGNATSVIKSGEFSDVYSGVGGGGTCTGKVEFVVSGGTMGGLYASQGHAVEEMTTTITGGTITTFYGRNNKGSTANIEKIKRVYNIVKDDGILDANGKDGPTITNFYGMGDRYGATDCVIDNDISGSATISNFYGGGYQNAGYNIACGTIKNTIDLSNEGSIGTFYGGHGGSETTKYTTDVGDIHNVIEKGAFNCYYGGSKIGDVDSITNEISGGTFAYTFGGASGATIGTVKNVIKGGSFEGIKGTSSSTSSNHYSAFFGVYSTSGVITGGIENDIQGGNFKAYTFGGSFGRGISNDEEGAPAIYNKISGGTFHGFWAGNSGTDDKIVGVIKNEISGGTFDGYVSGGALYTKVFGGGNRNAGNTQASIVNDISGGTFEYQVCFADFPHGDDYGGDGLTGSVTTKVTGGVFKGKVCTNTYGGTEKNLFPVATLTIDTTGDTAPEIYGEVFDCTTFTGNGQDVKIGKDTYIKTDTVTGTVKLHQTEGWLSNDYFVAPAGTEFSVTAEDGIFGEYEVVASNGATLRGKDLTAALGATLILDDRLNVRVLFDPATVANYAEQFTFAASLNGSALNVVAEEYEYEGTTYASYIIKALGLGNFDDTVAVSGDTFNDFTFTVVSLAEAGAENSADGSVAEKLFQSIANLGTYVNNSEATLKYSLAVEDVPAHETNASRTEGVEDVVLKTKTLIMSDAVGIRLSGTGSVDANSVKITVNGTDVTEYCVFGAGEGTFTVDLYVNASMLTSPLQVKVTNIPVEGEEEIVYLSYTERMDAFAKSVWDAGYESAKHALIFIQAVDAYKNA